MDSAFVCYSERVMKKILLTCLLISFIGGEVTRFTIFSNISFRLLDVIALCIFLACIFENVRSISKKNVFNFTAAKWLGGFFIIGILSLLFNLPNFPISEVGEGLLYLMRLVLYSGIFFYLKDIRKDEQSYVVTGITITGSILVVFGFIQYFYYNNLRNVYYLGWDDHMYRIFSVFLDPNFTGMLFSLFALFLMGRIWSKRKDSQKNGIYLLVCILAVTLVAVVMTFSRSALISLGTGSIIFLSLIGRKKYFLYLLLVLGGMIVLTIPFFYIENVNLFRSASSEARIESARNAISISKDHLLTGVGFNTYRYVQVKYGFRQGIGAEVSHADSGTDNSYLFILATTGIGGLIVYIGFLRSLFQMSWNAYKEKRSIFAIVFIASLSSVLIDSLFINSLFYPFIIVWLWMLVGLINYS